LWLDRSDRVRIQEKIVDYEVDGVSTKPIPTCEICMEKARGHSDATSRAEAEVGNKFVRISRSANVNERREH